MRKTALVAALALVALGTERAEACTDGDAPLFQAIGWTMLAGIGVGYVAGTGYFVMHDVEDDHQSLQYGGTEFGVNASLGLLLAGGAIASAKDGNTGTAGVVGLLAATHFTLAGHGAYRIYKQRGEFDSSKLPQSDVLPWVAGMAYTTNAIIWTSGLADPHERGYYAWEASVNGVLAGGAGYLAVDAYRAHSTGHAVAYGALGALSVAYTAHGIKNLVSPAKRSGGLEFLGGELAPTMTKGGVGLDFSGSW